MCTREMAGVAFYNRLLLYYILRFNSFLLDDLNSCKAFRKINDALKFAANNNRVGPDVAPIPPPPRRKSVGELFRCCVLSNEDV